MFHNLGSVTCPDRHVKAAKVMNILRCISPSETAMFEQHELSSVLSDLEDPFSDDDDHITATIKKKHLNQREKAKFLMNCFSDSHKRAAAIANRQPVDDEFSAADVSTSSDYFDCCRRVTIEPDPEFDAECKGIIAKSGLNVYLRRKEQEKADSDAKKKPKDGRHPVRHRAVPMKKPDQCAFDSTSLSGVWRMLDGQSMDNGFPITDVGYNIYEDKRLDWLCREDISYADREAVKVKCEKWMKKNKL